MHVVEADARDDFGGGYDRVLVDPPCSDLGTLASRPDARWRKSAEQIERWPRFRRQILERGGRGAAPGGTLVYSTCTISRRENEDGRRLAARRAVGPDAEARASRDATRYLQTPRPRPTRFFIARFEGGA